jgi:hypothetical protein
MEMQQLLANEEKAAIAKASQEVLLARMKPKYTPVGKPSMMH